MSHKTTMLRGAMAAVLLASTPVTGAFAVHIPFSNARDVDVARSGVKTVEWRERHYDGYRHRDGGNGAAIGLGIAGALIGGAIIADQANREDRAGYYEDRGVRGEEACAARFRSFDPYSGTYVGYDGARRVCPYL